VPWWGIAVPAGTPDTVVARLNSEFVRLFQEPKFNEVLDSNYCEAATGTPEQFAAFMKADRELAGKLVKKYNIPTQ
jgi:tripartite-type tricarboxylate transporter receptor subunit TctC